MALLSLIWPLGYKYGDIVTGIEAHLLRDKGVIRYIGDKYESVDNIEAEWVLGVPWLGIANFEFGFIEKARKYLAMTEKLYTSEGLPEAYSADSPVHNPLAWSHAMTIVLRTKLAAHTV
jgi:GH15 family glucan-1,4-alpha-glucosidase